MEINETELLEFCEHGILKEAVKTHFKQKDIDQVIENLKSQDKLEEIETPKGKMLVTLNKQENL